MSSSTNENSGSGEALIISYLNLRKFVGILGVALPFVSIVGTYIFSDCRTLLPSISQYYYSVMGDFFVGTLCGVAIFLFSYKGYNTWDKVLTNVAGVCAVASAFFPTHINRDYILCYSTDRDVTNFSDITHTITSGLFFISLAAISIFLFTKSKGVMTAEKKMRNKIYRVCGYTMIAAILLIGLYRIPAIHVYFERYKPTVILETLALIAFGFSWLTKGEFLLKDE
ncbi:MAG: hypothetical protein JWR18_2938 [Segetibacter sp.]|jgi:hypothetical protein|nr:hypothetical protein [Segetibacter sp.]